MSIAHQLDRYLNVRRSLGYDLRTAERILRRFVRFADRENASHIDTALFLRWNASLPDAGVSTRSARLCAVRLFTQWLSGIDPAHEVLPYGLLPSRYVRQHPYIYSEAEIAAIIVAAKALPSIYGLRGLTCSTLFGLIAVTGLRISEALALDDDDLDIGNGVLRVRRGKLGRERLLPLDPTVVAQLIAYTAERNRLLGYAAPAFFVTEKGTRLTDCGARYNFAHVCQRIGLRADQQYRRHGRGPRIHDLRHTFAVRTMIEWYQAGKDPAREMIRLTTYLGHTDPANTFWYLEAVPELLDLAMARATTSGEGGPMSAAALPALIQRFFTDRLCVQMEASHHTVAGYRDTFRLLLRFASVRHGKPPVKLEVEDIDADLVADFLVHTETTRGNTARSRNTRLAAIRSFFRYVAMAEPAWLLHCQRILAMPSKRYVRRAVTFLDADEIAALLAAPDRTTWAGRRDHALLLLVVQTGLRASELVGLTRGDVVLGNGAHVRCMGRAERNALPRFVATPPNCWRRGSAPTRMKTNRCSRRSGADS
jgi:integrase